jgi:hypothetical protein
MTDTEEELRCLNCGRQLDSPTTFVKPRIKEAVTPTYHPPPQDRHPVTSKLLQGPRRGLGPVRGL